MKLSAHIKPHLIPEKALKLAEYFFKAFEGTVEGLVQKIERDLSYDEKEDSATVSRTLIFESTFSTFLAMMKVNSYIVQNVNGGKVWEAKCEVDFKGKIEIYLKGEAGSSVVHYDQSEQTYLFLECSVTPVEAEGKVLEELKKIFDSLNSKIV